MAYQPSAFNLKNYWKYLSYLISFIAMGDFRSIIDSFRYVLFKRLPSRTRVVETKYGSFILRSGTTDFQFVNGTYESKVKEHISKYLDQIHLFIDIGACIGEYSIWLSRNGVKVIAVEPINHKILLDNFVLNGLDTSDVYQLAIGANEELVQFEVIGGVTSSSHLTQRVGEGTRTVRQVSLDYLLDWRSGLYGKSELTDPNELIIIKLDIEGSEHLAIQGAVNTIISHNKLHIIFEEFEENKGKVQRVLDKLGKFMYIDLDGVNKLAVKTETW